VHFCGGGGDRTRDLRIMSPASYHCYTPLRYDASVILHYDREGNPIDLWEWARLHAIDEYRIVAQHWVRGWLVSTVWLGINHNWCGGTPIIFETMVFPPTDASGDDMMSECFMDRYATEAAALAGHDQVLTAVLDQLGAGQCEALTSAEFAFPPES
jgi:hypothetical protein